MKFNGQSGIRLCTGADGEIVKFQTGTRSDKKRIGYLTGRGDFDGFEVVIAVATCKKGNDDEESE